MFIVDKIIFDIFLESGQFKKPMSRWFDSWFRSTEHTMSIYEFSRIKHPATVVTLISTSTFESTMRTFTLNKSVWKKSTTFVAMRKFNCFLHYMVIFIEFTIERLRELRAKRSRKKVKKALEKLGRTAEGQENLMPYLFEAVKAYATNGEISDTLREVFGEYKATTIV